MKKLLVGIAAAGMAMSASVAAAQTISPECVTAAANAGVSQDYNVVFDAESGTCVASPLGEAVVSTQTAPAGTLGGLGTGGAIAAGVAGVVVVGIATTGGT